MGADNSSPIQKICYNFRELEVATCDCWFTDASHLLSRLEEFRLAFTQKKARSIEISAIWKLKTPRYIETIRVLYWSLSAMAGGDISQITQPISEPPFISLTMSPRFSEIRELYECVAAYLRACKSLSTLELILEELEKLVKRIDSLDDKMDFIRSEAKELNLGMLGVAKTAANFSHNEKKLRAGLEEGKKLRRFMEEAKKVESSYKKYRSCLAEADTMGSKCYLEGIVKPGEILTKCHPSPLKSSDEIKQEREAILNNQKSLNDYEHGDKFVGGASGFRYHDSCSACFG